MKIGSRRLEYAALGFLRAVFFCAMQCAAQQTMSDTTLKSDDTIQWSERSKEFTENSFNNRLKFTIWFDGMGLLVYHIFMCEYSFWGNKMARTFAILKNHEV